MEDPIFTVDKLDDNTLGHLEYIVNSPSWDQVLRPFLENARHMYLTLLEDPNPDIRRRYGGTKYLRCGANNIKKQLEFYDKILAETNHDRAMTSRAQIGQDDLYLEAVQKGVIGPAGKKPVDDDYPPETEF